jgi:hypothetical protein
VITVPNSKRSAAFFDKDTGSAVEIIPQQLAAKTFANVFQNLHLSDT